MQGFDSTSSVPQIISDLNLTNDAPSGPVTTAITALFASYVDKAAIYPRLQYLYAARQAVDNLIGGVWNAVEWKQADVEEQDNEFTANLVGMRGRYHDEILRLEEVARAQVYVGAAQMTATAPAIAPAGTAGGPFDPNWTGYRGDPTIRTRRGWGS